MLGAYMKRPKWAFSQRLNTILFINFVPVNKNEGRNPLDLYRAHHFTSLNLWGGGAKTAVQDEGKKQHVFGFLNPLSGRHLFTFVQIISQGSSNTVKPRAACNILIRGASISIPGWGFRPDCQILTVLSGGWRECFAKGNRSQPTKENAQHFGHTWIHHRT